MPTNCQITGCKSTAPAALAEQQLCVLHYTLSIEGNCAEMRRETAMGNAPHERLKEIMKFLTENGERLARVATSGMSLTDDLKARILSTFLTLMNLRENLDRASMRGSVGRSGGFREGLVVLSGSSHPQVWHISTAGFSSPPFIKVKKTAPQPPTFYIFPQAR